MKIVRMKIEFYLIPHFYETKNDNIDIKGFYWLWWHFITRSINKTHGKKDIKELTESEAKEILKFAYPNNKDNWFKKLSFEPKMTNDGRQLVTFGMRSIIGIEYHNGQDNCILHFDNTRVVLWLYKNGYDITELLKANSHLSEIEKDFENFAFAIIWLAKGEEGFRDDMKHNWTLDYVKKKCKELVQKYYYKDYDEQ